MTTPPPLERQAENFAAEMNGLLLSTVTNDVSLASSKADLTSTLYIVGNQVDLAGHDRSNIATLRGERFPVAGLEDVELSATWVFVPSSSGNWLKSWSSSFGLYVDGAPFIRLEVDPEKPEGSWLQAHIHVTGESGLLGYLRGMRGQKKTRLQHLHLPVGGFLFRPGIEDFLEFAIDEELIPGKEGWKAALDATREEFTRKQFMAMIGRRLEWARRGVEEADRRKALEEE